MAENPSKPRRGERQWTRGVGSPDPAGGPERQRLISACTGFRLPAPPAPQARPGKLPALGPLPGPGEPALCPASQQGEALLSTRFQWRVLSWEPPLADFVGDLHHGISTCIGALSRPDETKRV